MVLHLTDPQLTPIEGGYRVATTDTHHIDVLIMLYNARVVETPIDCPLIYERYWCYSDLIAALLAAYVWDGSQDTEPVGWVKAWDGRRGNVQG